MKLKSIHYFLGGVALTALVAAARFVGGTPLDQTFTYQGQLRNAGQLVSGPVDLRITLWDSDTAGSQVGSANSFNAMQLTDGRFACGLNFGTAAFDGSNRWIQVEFRNPAGSGQYLALSPRDKITATPYALYALNGANGVWVYDTNQQSVSVMGKKVGIGTSNPTAALEVVDANGGDDSVKLPAGSVGASELAESLPAVIQFSGVVSRSDPRLSRQFTTGSSMVATCLYSGSAGGNAGNTTSITLSLRIDGIEVMSRTAGIGPNLAPYWPTDFQTVAIPSGTHTIEIVGSSPSTEYYNNWWGSLRVEVILTNEFVPTN